MREKTIEHKLALVVRQLGGFCPKLTCPGYDGMPDRLVLLPGGHCGFVEVKASGRNPRPIQAARHRTLARLGYKVYVLDAQEQIPGIIRGIATTDE